MLSDLTERPGLLFVAATLLPLASFVVLLLWAALRWGLRPYARPGGVVATIFQALGGPTGFAAPAYVALGAIALAFVCSATGFGFYLPDHNTRIELVERLEALEEEEHAAEHAQAEKEHGHGHGNARFERERKAIQHELNTLESRWAESFAWLSVHTAPNRVPSEVRDGFATTLRLGYRIDMLSAVMFVMVTFVATLIHLFSTGYMVEELRPVVEDHEIHIDHGHFHRRGRFGRFFMFLSLFCFSMLNLLLADNLFQIFVSWELVGVCSYLLISFYYERTSASNAANKAFITNRIGDAGFIIGLLILWTHVGTLNFQELFDRIRAPERDSHEHIAEHHRFITANLGETGEDGGVVLALKRKAGERGENLVIFPRDLSGHWHFADEEEVVGYANPTRDQFSYMPYWMLVLAGLGIFLGCVGKSAQFPLHVWLPDAMEGPTPVSALIHAATMVAAGVYLVGRCYPLFAPEVLLTIAYVGGITLFVAATIAVVMNDIKRVLAYSTVSQLGYMMLGLGVGGWAAGLFHLITHAFFKALLFLGSGSVIYGCHHQQDMMRMGGLYPKMRITAITMLVGVLTIAGIPFFSGWYSKDSILVAALSFVSGRGNSQHFLLFALPLVTAGITTFYMFRMWFMTFAGEPRDHHVYEEAHESPWTMTLPLILLAILSVSVGWGWPAWEADKSWLEHQLHHTQHAGVHADLKAGEIAATGEEHERLGYGLLAGGLATGMVVLGLAFACAIYYFRTLDPVDATAQFPGVHRFLAHKWYFDELYSAIIVRPGLTIAHWCRAIDTYVIDGFLNGLARWNVFAARVSGQFDRYVVDGLVNLLANVWFGIGLWLRVWQTGSIRSYVLFLGLAAVGIWVVLYFLIAGTPPVTGAAP